MRYFLAPLAAFALLAVPAAARPPAWGTGVYMGHAASAAVITTFQAAGVTDGNTCTGSCATVGNIGSSWSSGDLLIVLYNGATNTINFATASVPSGLMTDMSATAQYTCAWNFKAYYKQLTGADVNGVITTTSTPAAAPVAWYIVHGPTTAAVRSSPTSGGGCGAANATSLTLTGFTSAGNTAGALIITQVDRSKSVPTSVTSFTQRLSNAASANNTFFHTGIFDNLSYASSGNVPISSFTSGSSSQPSGWLIELLN